MATDIPHPALFNYNCIKASTAIAPNASSAASIARLLHFVLSLKWGDVVLWNDCDATGYC